MNIPTKPTVVTTIPDDYRKALGGSGELRFPPFLETTRIAIGPAFSGKSSTFVRQPQTGYLDAQGGARFSPPGEGSLVFQCRNWPEVDTRWSRFIRDAQNGRCPFKHLVLDPFMRVRQWYEEFLDAQYAAETMKMKEGTPAREKRMGLDGKPKAFKLAMGQKYEDWVNNNLMAMLNASRDAGLYWTVILHERTKEERKDPTSEYSPLVVTEGAAVGMNLFQKLCREADFFFDFESIQYGGDPAKATPTGNTTKKWQTAEMAAYEADRVIVRTRCTARTAHITNYDRGVRIPLPETIELPRSCAYETLERIYEESKAREMVFWASKKSQTVGANNLGVTAPTPSTGVTPQEYVP